MKKTVWKKGICLLVVIATILSGMCFEKLRTDSSFSVQKCSSGSVLSSKASVLSGDNDLCTRELLGLGDTKEVVTQQTRFSRENRFSKLMLSFFVLAVSSEKSLKKLETTAFCFGVLIQSTWHQTICYIHRQDGAKG